MTDHYKFVMMVAADGLQAPRMPGPHSWEAAVTADFVADRAAAKDRSGIAAIGAGLTGISVGLIIWGGPVGLAVGIPGAGFFEGYAFPSSCSRLSTRFLHCWGVSVVLQRHASAPGLVT
jgi:hypothetical protein